MMSLHSGHIVRVSSWKTESAVFIIRSPPLADAPPAPNLLLLSLDTLGADPVGDPGITPRIEAFAGDGFSFDRAYAQYPGTLVSHTSLFTSLHPVHHGRYDRSFEE